VTSTTVTIAARNGVPLLVRAWPATGEPRATVLIVHGLAEHSGRYERTGSILAATGLAVEAFDLQGFGGSGGRRAHIDAWATWLDNVEDRLAVLRASGEGRPVVLLGHSLGGLVALTYAESDRHQPDLLILSSPWLADFLPEWRRTVARVGGLVLPTVSVANGIDGLALSRDPVVGADYRVDPLAHHRTTLGLGRLLVMAQSDALAHLDRLRIPALVTHGGADPLVPTVSSEVLATLPDIERKVYPNLRHETLNEPEGPAVVADMAVWIRAHLGSSASAA
jgi:alpha-beta hydrolase superfamily lysophospholipase